MTDPLDDIKEEARAEGRAEIIPERDALRALLATARNDLEKMTRTAEIILETGEEEPGTTYESALAIECAWHTLEQIDGLTRPSAAVLIDRAHLATLLDAGREFIEINEEAVKQDHGDPDALIAMATANAAAERALGLAPDQDTRTMEA